MYETPQDLMKGIADAIREKKSTVGTIDHQDMPSEILSISTGNSTFYDLDYVFDNSIVFWADGKSNSPIPTDVQKDSRYWTPKYDYGGYNGDLGSSVSWTEDGGLLLPERSTKSYARFQTYYTFRDKGSFTMECYVKFSENFSSGNNEFFSSRESGGFNFGCKDGYPLISCALTSGTAEAKSDDILTLDTKYLITAVLDTVNQTLSLYVNGVLKKQVAANYGMSNPSTCIWIGNDGQGSSPESSPSTYAMIGTVYSARIYNRALSQTEIAKNYAVDVERFE